MLGINTILHPSDFSQNSEYAFRLAQALARDQGARLIVLHVGPLPLMGVGGVMAVPPPQPEEYGRPDLEAKLRTLQAPELGDRLEHRLVFGEPVAEILSAAQKQGIGLIVMGTHGRTGAKRLLMGSIAEQIVRRATCPVLTVRHPPAETQR